MATIGLDIGGANIKAAHSAGAAISHRFPLWKRPNALTDELRSVVLRLPPADRWAVTMTGELCDCFATKREGVLRILDAVESVAGPTLTHVWRNDGRFVSLKEARAEPLPVAAANWLATATFASRFAPHGNTVLIDIGSTTTDIVPIVEGRPVPTGRTDVERLDTRELVYTGVSRTPVCALLEPGEGMAEFFATMHDVYLTLGSAADNADECDTADGRPATREFALARLARMLGGDVESIDARDIGRFAEHIAAVQHAVILNAMIAVGERLPGGVVHSAIVTGAGEQLARDVASEFAAVFERPVEAKSLADRLSPDGSACAAAVAVAQLLEECRP